MEILSTTEYTRIQALVCNWTRKYRPRLVAGIFVGLTALALLLALRRNSNADVSSSPQNVFQSSALWRIPSDRRLVNLRDFKFLATPRCPDSTLKSVQIAVHSSRHNYLRRDAIRRTWGSLGTLKGWSLSVVFLLGAPPDSPPEDAFVTEYIGKEMALHEDLIIGSFLDSYRNLTYKHMMGYKWLLDACGGHADAYVKTDDDVFLNVYRLTEWLRAEPNNLDGDHFNCYVLRGYSPWRSRRYKFYISKDEYKPEKFPDYCSGVGYVTTPGLLRKLLPLSGEIPYLWVEDLFSTGLLASFYNGKVRRKVSEGSWMDYNDHVLGPSEIQLRDMSQLYLNEQYAIYREWLVDEGKGRNPWLFILLETKRDRVARDQMLLWNKTSALFRGL